MTERSWTPPQSARPSSSCGHTPSSRSKKVVIGVANQRVIVRQVDLPGAPPTDELSVAGLPGAGLRAHARGARRARLPPLEELTTTLAAGCCRGMLVAASREMVLNAASRPSEGGSHPVTVDLSSFAVLRSLADSDRLGMGSQVEALVDVGAEVTNIVVHQGGAPRFIRILLMGGEDSPTLSPSASAFRGQAEAMKQQLGLGTAGDGMDVQAATRVVEAVGAAFVDEVRGSLDYYLGLRGLGSDLPAGAHRGRCSARAAWPQRLQVTTRVPARGRSTRCHNLAGGPHRALARSRSRSLSPWQQCRWAWPWELQIMSTLTERDTTTLLAGAATGQPAATGDRGSSDASSACRWVWASALLAAVWRRGGSQPALGQRPGRSRPRTS